MHQAPAAQDACAVRSVRQNSTAYENAAFSPSRNQLAVTQLDAKGIYQVYVGRSDGSGLKCISCTALSGVPKLDRNKPMISWHPSGQWLVVGVEENVHDNAWWPTSWKRGLLQSGIWLNMWMTTPTGDRWYQVTDFKKSKTNPSDGYVGVPFTPDGRRAVWAEIIDGNVLAYHFGRWKLFIADFSLSPGGAPSLTNKRDITPAGANWVEPGNFAPDGRRVLLSADIGIKDAQGQDQWSLDTTTGKLLNLNNSPQVWDEHGLYSPDGAKIVFMSSAPYSSLPKSFQAASLKTEFMLMDADGSNVRQLTHFNTPGYQESQPSKTIAAVAAFNADGSELFATVMGPNFTKTNWLITFAGPCGSQSGKAPR